LRMLFKFGFMIVDYCGQPISGSDTIHVSILITIFALQKHDLLYSVSNISISFSGIPVFRDIGFLVNKKDRIGLVGMNGSGKTTLLRIISDQMEPESGEVVIPFNSKVGYLPQEMKLHSQQSVRNEAAVAFEEVSLLKKRIDDLSEQINIRVDYTSKDYKSLVENLAESQEEFNMMGGHQVEGSTEKVLMGLGFKRDELDRSLGTFSYGWQMRVEIAKILLKDPDLLLLDEPTNHLDIESIQWLETYLKDFPGAIILVSHDRAFLDNITNRTIEIENERIFDYKASYSDYIGLREQRLESQLAAYNNQQRQIRQIERFIERFRYKNTKARQVQSRIKMLDKIEEVQIDEFDMSSIQFRFPQAPPSGKVVVNAEHLYKSFGDKKVLSDLNFAVIKGDRIAFVGRNGEGKTTLSKIITRNLDYTGGCKLGFNVKTGYFAQNQDEILDPELTVFETIDHVATGDARAKIRTLLGGFLFGENDIDKKVKVLSGGEKTRLALAKLLLEPVNFLILDEPTNHLDMRSKDILKNALLLFEGTIVVVSHDRDFLQGLTTKVFEFRNNSVREHIGDIYDFLETRRLSHLNELEMKVKSGIGDKSKNPLSDNKILYEKRRQLEKDIRKVASRLEKVENDIEKTEVHLRELEKKLSNPESTITSGELSFYDQYGKMQKNLAGYMEDWEKLHMELEELKGKRDALE